jgi:hypothetical protein
MEGGLKAVFPRLPTQKNAGYKIPATDGTVTVVFLNSTSVEDGYCS